MPGRWTPGSLVASEAFARSTEVAFVVDVKELIASLGKSMDTIPDSAQPSPSPNSTDMAQVGIPLCLYWNP